MSSKYEYELVHSYCSALLVSLDICQAGGLL
jgi:hypothetical protein